jgi:hypothetical protein
MCHGLAECRKQHTAHIKGQHKERCGWHVEEWQMSLVLAAWCTGVRAKRARRCSRWGCDTGKDKGSVRRVRGRAMWCSPSGR